MTVVKFRETKYMKISRNFAKVILQNCTETNFVSFLQLNSYRIWISTQYFMILYTSYVVKIIFLETVILKGQCPKIFDSDFHQTTFLL